MNHSETDEVRVLLSAIEVASRLRRTAETTSDDSQARYCLRNAASLEQCVCELLDCGDFSAEVRQQVLAALEPGIGTRPQDDWPSPGSIAQGRDDKPVDQHVVH